MNDLSEAKIFPRRNLEEMVSTFIADNNIHAVYGKDVEGLHIVHFLVDEEDEEDEETLALSEAEKLDLNSFFIETVQSDHFLSSEVHDRATEGKVKQFKCPKGWRKTINFVGIDISDLTNSRKKINLID